MNLALPVESVRGVGPRRAADLARGGIHTRGDLLLHLPFRYDDRRVISRIAELVVNRPACVRGTIVAARVGRPRGMTLVECVIADDSGRLRALWFNQPFLRHELAKGRSITLYGTPTRDPRVRAHLTMSSPEHALVDESLGIDVSTESGRIVPVYERVGSVSGRVLRQLVTQLIAELPADLPDPLPSALRERWGLVGLGAALREVHAPADHLDASSWEALQRGRSLAHQRLILEELLLLQVALTLRRLGRAARPECALIVDERVRQACSGVFPFRLTDAQRRAAREIASDLAGPRPMRRLLQGDVGSGKTAVALLAMLVVVENGAQAALMAPTEILAEQHSLTLKRWLAGRGRTPELLTSAIQGAEREAALARIASGQASVVVGTQALLEPRVRFARLGLAVIDEQHRFGVLERQSLAAKSASAHLLVMTATPIPRTLALTAYGDLDVSVLNELPPGRQPVRTVLRSAAARRDVVELVRREVAAAHQAYVVFPIVEESERLEDIRAAASGVDEWRRALPSASVELLHGRMATADREVIMRCFARGEIDVLVATTVIEVGIDVANATVIVVEHAERFGLAQLHQLRGRVGRGAAASTCVLLAYGRHSPEARARLNAMLDTCDGFVIAERDLAIRGPGELMGTRQSGLPRLRVADLVRDAELIPQARAEAERLVAEQGVEQAAEWLKSAEWERRFGVASLG